MGIRDRATMTERVSVGAFGGLVSFGGLAMHESSSYTVLVIVGFLMFIGGILVALAAVNDEV